MNKQRSTVPGSDNILVWIITDIKLQHDYINYFNHAANEMIEGKLTSNNYKLELLRKESISLIYQQKVRGLDVTPKVRYHTPDVFLCIPNIAHGA